MDTESSSRANMRVPVEQNRGNIFERSFDCSRPFLRELGSVLRELGSDKLSK